MRNEKRERYTVYSDASHITFIMEDIFDAENVLIATECVGWYYGFPEDARTEEHAGKTTFVYNR